MDVAETAVAPEESPSRVRRLLAHLPAVLSSTAVIAFGVFLFFYLFVFAAAATWLGHPDAVSQQWQLILGNYTNVSSSVGAGIAAGLGVKAVKHMRAAEKRHAAADKLHAETQRLTQEIHTLLHHVYGIEPKPEVQP